VTFLNTPLKEEGAGATNGNSWTVERLNSVAVGVLAEFKMMFVVGYI
jgi:hypothetical protein